MEPEAETSEPERPLQTLIVVEFDKRAQVTTIQWLVSKIGAKRSEGGAELNVKVLGAQEDKGQMLFISAPTLRLLEAAELLEIKKKDHEGYLREFSLQDMELFLYGDTEMEKLLSTAEKQRIILHELETMRSLPEDDNILPGYPELQLYTGQPIFVLCRVEEIITQVFPLQENEELDDLGQRWYWALFSKQPIEDIRSYFGEAIAIYFAFLGFYTVALVLPAIVGIVQFLLTMTDKHEFAFFAFFNLVLVTLFLEAWKRNCNELAYKWGTIRTVTLSEPRPSYRGPMKVSPVTGRYEPSYPRWKTMAKTYAVSFPLVLLCLSFAFVIMLTSFWAEDYMQHVHRDCQNSLTSLMTYVPSVIYAIVVWIMSGFYNKIATFLTEWENHRTQTQFDHHRIVKLVLFEFVNNFMSLFYIAFYIQDLEMLQSQVAVMLIIQQGINHFQEALLPYFTLQWYQKWNSKMINTVGNRKKMNKAINNKRDQEEMDKATDIVEHKVSEMGVDEPELERVLTESKMDPYEGTYDDYLEMFIQFGYVFLFSSVFPLAAFWAIFNNVLEIRADAFKLCKAFQRPIAKQAKNIGAWQIAFEVMGAIAVMTNCALLGMSSELRSYFSSYSAVEWTLLLVTIEHFILLVKVLLAYIIPDVPEWVSHALAKTDYESKQALKNERLQKTRKHLKRLHKTAERSDVMHTEESALQALTKRNPNLKSLH